jgi:hypothetical protein
MAQEHLQTLILGYGAEVIFHVLGFSAAHNEEFLESLTFLGTSDGSYSFVSPKVSPIYIRDLFHFLFIQMLYFYLYILNLLSVLPCLHFTLKGYSLRYAF